MFYTHPVFKNLGHYKIVIEVFTWCAGLLFFIYRLNTFFQGETSMCCDSISSEFPSFYYFAENLLQGRLSLWNPFAHAGEPFYPQMFHTRLLDPNASLTILIGQFFTRNLLVLYHWHRLVQTLIMGVGAYVVIRRYSTHLWVRLSLIPIFLYSAFMFSSFRQVGVILHFLWIPWIHLCLEKILFERRKYHLLLSGLLGLQFQSYWFVESWLYLFIFCVATGWKKVQKAFWNKESVPAFLILTLMAFPEIVLWWDHMRFVFPMRIKEDFSLLNGTAPGTYSPSTMGNVANFWNYLSLIYIGKWGEPAETFMYMGFLPWLLAIIGIIYGKAEKHWKILFITFFLIHLGSSTPLGTLFFKTLPIFHLIRHPSQFNLTIIFLLLYFFTLGTHRLKELTFKEVLSPLGMITGGYAGYGLASISLPSFTYWALCFLVLVTVLYWKEGKRAVFSLLVMAHLSAIGFHLDSKTPYFIYVLCCSTPLIIGLAFRRTLYPLLFCTILFELSFFLPSFRGFYLSPVTAWKLGVPREPKAPVFPNQHVVNPYPEGVDGNPIVNPGLLLKRAALFGTNVSRNLTEARKEWPHNNYFLLKPYASTIYSDQTDAQVLETFAVYQPTLQWKGNAPPRLQIKNYSYDVLALRINSTQDGVLNWKTIRDPHWTTFLDGKKIEIPTLTHLVPIPAGEHEVVFQYRPTLLLLAFGLFYFGFLTSILFSLRHLRTWVDVPLRSSVPSPSHGT